MRLAFNKLPVLAACVVAVSALGGCSTWEMNVPPPTAKDVGVTATPNEKLGAFGNVRPYLQIHAKVIKPQDAGTICGDSWASGALRQKDVTVILAAQLSDTVKVPLFSAGYAGEKQDCNRSFTSAYVVPRVTSDGTNLDLPVQTGWSQTSQSKVSGYLDSAKALTAALAIASPVVTTVTTVVGSALAKSVEAEANRNMTFSNTDKFEIIQLDLTQERTRTVNRDYTFEVWGIETDNFQPKQGGQRIHLATVVLELRWSRSAIGDDSANGVMFADSASPGATKITVFDAINGKAVEKTLQQAVADRNVADGIPSFRADTTRGSAQAICSSFKQAFPEFNALDQAAMLWIFYRNTDLAQAIGKKNGFSDDPCFSFQQIVTLAKMGLPPIGVPAPSVAELRN